MDFRNLPYKPQEFGLGPDFGDLAVLQAVEPPGNATGHSLASVDRTPVLSPCIYRLLTVFIMAAHPEGSTTALITAFGRQVKVVVSQIQQVDATRIS